MKNLIRNLQKAAITLTVVLFSVMMAVTQVAYDNKSTITAFFGVPDYIIHQGDGEEEVDPSTMEYFESQYKNIRELVYGGYEIQLEEQREGTVLLSNNGALPLAKGSKVSLFGNACTSPFYGASGSGGINTSNAISWEEAFKGVHYEKEDPKAKITPDAADYYFTVNPTLLAYYKATAKNNTPYVASSSQTKVQIGDIPWSMMSEAADSGISDLATYGDAAIMIIKRTGGEGYDLPATTSTTKGEYSIDKTNVGTSDGTDGDYLQLNANEKSILEGLKAAKTAGTVKKIILVLNMASTIQLDFLKSNAYNIDACLWTGAVGEYGTLAVTKLLVGEDNFSGGLSTTLWTDNLMNPVNSNYADNNYYFQYDNYADFGFQEMTAGYQSSFTSYMVYQEGMYLGYKYTETRYEDYVMGVAKTGSYDYDKVVAYPFGYGKSYTTFEFSGLNVTKNDRKYSVSVNVKNTGSVAGKTPVQVYVAKPYGNYERENKIQVPSVQLIDFGKSEIIPAGETKTVTVEVDEKYFATYDTFGEGTYVITPGKYRLVVAANAHDAVNNLLAHKGYTPENTSNRMDAKGDSKLVYERSYALDLYYSMSTATGNPIRNAFSYADINTYDGKGTNSVEYYSRDNWEGTVKLSYRDGDGKLVKPYVKLKMTQAMADTLRDQMDSSKVIQKDDTPYPTYGAENGLVLFDLKGEEYNSLLWDELLDQMTWDETVELLSNGRHKTVAIASVTKPGAGDENGPNGQSHNYANNISAGSAYAGPKNPYGYRIQDPDAGKGYSSTGFSSNGILAATFNKETAAKVGKQIGEEGLWGGTSGLLGTGLNIQRSPYAGRTSEYYSEDAMLSGLIAAPETAATESMGVHCFIKHCAMNESETARHGVQFWITEQAMRENYFRAFEIVIEEGNAFNVMTSFSRIGVWAVANSVEFTKNFLRNECGLPGIVETDCAGDMTDNSHGEAYVSRIVNVYTGATDLNEYNYGVDKNDHENPAIAKCKWADFAPVENGGPGGYGKLAQAMRESCKRILYATLSSNAMCGYSSDTRIEKIMVPWEKAVIAIDVVLGVLMLASVAWLAVDVILKTVKKKSA